MSSCRATNENPWVAVLDPTWPRENGGGRRGANMHYRLSRNTKELSQEYIQSPAWEREGPALIWIWTTSSSLVFGDLHLLALDLNIQPCAQWVWAKVDVVDANTRLQPADARYWRYTHPSKMGLGQWSRCEHEHLVLCRRGKVSVPPQDRRQRSMIYAPRSSHSEKPEPAWKVIEATSGIGIEFNARTVRSGWDAVGRLGGEDKPMIWRKYDGTIIPIPEREQS